MTSKNFRRLPFTNVANARDLGGYPTKKGGMTRYGVFYRSGNLHKASSQDVELIRELGISTIIDLRYQDECTHMPNVDLGDSVTTHNISLFADLSPERLAVKHGEADTQTLIHMYLQVINECSNKLKEVFEVLASVEEGASLIHCAVGKDRTGIIVMFLLSLAGVEDVDIVADYEVSRTYIASFSDDLSGSHYSNMSRLLTYIHEKYGSPEGYLESIGIDRDKLERIRKRILLTD
ncbi:tyrosine-protein phosphatase [Paenibacillus senegalensis]|uniref:tyrosine-protein phosphatase n=1 Tax=Paenibacillus senegalensis TaxID=1465766 RepID=UPI00028943F3|nr:tyrosine-protein phosphatase [Paenibacillus senegalensis]